MGLAAMRDAEHTHVADQQAAAQCVAGVRALSTRRPLTVARSSPVAGCLSAADAQQCYGYGAGGYGYGRYGYGYGGYHGGAYGAEVGYGVSLPAAARCSSRLCAPCMSGRARMVQHQQHETASWGLHPMHGPMHGAVHEEHVFTDAVLTSSVHAVPQHARGAARFTRIR
jgi:hypothetical protein